jgi:hypothetical protein
MLLVREVLINRHKNIEVLFSQRQETPVFDTGPTHSRNGLDLVSF